MDWLNFLWLFFIISSLTPVLQQRWIEGSRLRLIRKLERERRSRAITLIPLPGNAEFPGHPFLPLY